MAKGAHMGSWAFLIGVILAVIFGFIGSVQGVVSWILVVLGLVIGLLNIAEKEVEPFLMAGTVLVIVSALGNDVMGSILYIGNILNALLVLFVPATVIVALKHVFSMARN
ncbi:MAG: hypothetical protein HYS32_02295 [Candidatus Woesearchaeota archaeon]|nr:MAG: hypothetical protein HYS32_02295 [Candidatus Woesearchaeota archaeon]